MTTRDTEIFFQYSKTIAQEFQSRLNRMRVFVQHNLTTGNANEVILREFLSTHAPGNICVGQGFICNPLQKEQVSRQCDILIYNQNDYPTVYADGSVKVVFPDAVRMVIEVKTSINKTEMHNALRNVISARQLRPDYIQGIVFVFKSRSLKTVLGYLESFNEITGEEDKPEAIFLLDKAIVIHRWMYSRMRDENVLPVNARSIKTYAIRECQGETLAEKQGVAVAFLLMLFFQAIESGWMPSEPANLLLDMIEKYTEKKPGDVHIGMPSA